MITGLFRELFPYVVLLYLADCIGYSRSNCAVFTSLTGRNYAVRGTGFHLRGLLPDSTSYVTTKQLPLPAPSGVYFPTAAAGEGLYLEKDFQFVAYEEMKDLRCEEHSLLLKGEKLAAFCSPEAAKRAAGLFSNLAEANLPAREEQIEKFLGSHTDRTALQEKRAAVDSRIETLKLLSFSFFMFVFLVVPLVVYTPLVYRVNGKLLPGITLLFYVLVAAFTYRKAGILSRYGPVKKLPTLLTVVLYPISALHAPHMLTLSMYSNHACMTLASVFLSPEGFGDILRPELHRIGCSLEREAGNEFRNCLLGMKSRLERLAEEAGLSLEAVTAPPERRDPAAECYCPICVAEYVAGSTECVDCRAPLRKYGETLRKDADGTSS